MVTVCILNLFLIVWLIYVNCNCRFFLAKYGKPVPSRHGVFRNPSCAYRANIVSTLGFETDPAACSTSV
uniref:Putative secreted protein n=1 Tax=Amblyomma cajennense TaxID=34607 RepID=A0A023FDB7_AMBCJ